MLNDPIELIVNAKKESKYYFDSHYNYLII